MKNGIFEVSIDDRNLFIRSFDSFQLSLSDDNLLDILKACKPTHGYFVNDVCVGMLLLGVHYQLNTSHIGLLLIHPNYRGLGIGKLLMQQAIHERTKMTVTVNPYTYDAEQFYRKIGFVLDPRFDPNDPNTMVYRG